MSDEQGIRSGETEGAPAVTEPAAAWEPGAGAAGSMVPQPAVEQAPDAALLAEPAPPEPVTPEPTPPEPPTDAGAEPKPPAEVLPSGRPYRVKILYSSSTELYTCPQGTAYSVGDLVVVPTRHGNELGRILGVSEPEEETPENEVRIIIRAASPADLSRIGDLELKEEGAFSVCREKISARGLEMKLVSAHYLLDEQKILFFFTAENRIDFRDLVKDLVSIFKTRIELRQIGVRDEARVVGGVGICGRVLCCNSITDRLRPVSIKMAKEQNLTLNSMKISGPCGRLLCCLSYEFDAYREARQQLPALGTRIPYEGEEFKVSDMNVLARRIRFESGSGRVLDLGFESLSRAPNGAWEIRIRTAPGQ
jgi:cell fate regulator YaaT (PSP1 superfamily)